MSREDILKLAPELPYRALTEGERIAFYAYVKGFPEEDRDRFWQQTQEEARKVIGVIRGAGFVVGGEFCSGSPMDGLVGHSHVYPRNYQGKDVGKVCDYERVIGSVDLWDDCGFISNPVKIWYQNHELIDDAFALREYLLSAGISFADNVDLNRLRKNIAELEEKRKGEEKILARLKDLELKR